MTSNFELLTSFELTWAPALLKKWRSRRTGLQAVHIARESPIVDGFFAVATEVADDSGTPHTLEHLVFMGSHKYPYKGLLDTLGNKAFSSTNAWTAVDQTVYTLTSAGWEGFKQLLPIYLDHILNPTLTDEACYTEVYHVDGEGKEKGVVFSEMQGIQNQSWFLSFLNSQRALYPPQSGYSSETGGLLENLRKLSNDTIRKFHESAYRPSNLCVIVSGTIDETELLEILNKFDNELPPLAKVHPRPFVDSKYTISPLKEQVVKHIEFPDKDESSGEILIAWVGPKHEEYEEDLAVTLLLEYLSDSSISLLTKNLVEIDQPLATEVEYNTDNFTYVVPNIKLNDVPTSKLDEAETKFWSLLKEHANVEEFDLVRMREIIENSKLKLIAGAEKSSDIITDYVVTDFLYSDIEGKALKQNLKTMNDYDTIAKWSASQFVGIFKKYFIENRAAVIIAKPSKTLYKNLKQESLKLLKDRKAKLGEKGLEKLKDRLEDAMARNDTPIPAEIIGGFPKPDASKIQFINTTSVAIGTNKDYENDLSLEAVAKIVKDTPKDFPLYINIEQFKSQFVSIEIIMSSFEIPTELLPYFEIFTGIFSLPLEVEGIRTPFEQVIKDLQNDTIETSFDNSFHYQFEELLTAKIVVKRENYTKGIDWFEKIFFRTKFDEVRVKTTIDKFLNGLPSIKRSPLSMLHSLISRNNYTSRSLKNSKDPLIAESFYRELSSKIENGEYGHIEKDLESFRNHLFKSNNLRIVIGGDIFSIEQPIKKWESFVKAQKLIDEPLTSIPRSFDALTVLGSNLVKKALIIAVPASESTFLNLTSNVSTDYKDKDSTAISLACSYLQAVEGPFWRGIRGTGLAYGANINKRTEDARIVFDIYRGADAIKAFSVAAKIVKDLGSGTTKFDPTLVDGAISSLVNSIASSESNYYSAAGAKYLDNVLKKRGPKFNNKFIEELSKITIDDLVRVINEYFVPLFSSESSAVFVGSHPSKVEELKEFFEGVGYEVSVEEDRYMDDESAEREDDDYESEEDGSESDFEEDTGDESDED